MSEATEPRWVEPVRVLSDLHLGHPASRISRVAALRPLLEGAGTVIFNGDTAEQCYRGWREAGDTGLRELQVLCRDVGARAAFLPGNHDPEVSPTGWLSLAQGAALITHGHAVFPSVAPWSPEFRRKKVEIRRLLRTREAGTRVLRDRWETTRLVTKLLVPDRPKRRGIPGAYLLGALWPPERCYHILRVWLTMVKEAERFTARFAPEARVLLFGHFHRSGVWKRKGRILCNTGAFMSGSRPLIAELQDGRLRVSAVEERDGEFRIGADRGTFALDSV